MAWKLMAIFALTASSQSSSCPKVNCEASCLGGFCAEPARPAELPEDSASFIQAWTAASTPRFEESVANPHPWKKTETILVTPRGASVTADLYFVRHGQNVVNEWVKAHHGLFPQEKDGGYWDGALTKLGVQQAALLQDTVTHKLHLDKLPADSIQLAASLNSRAFDTLVIASAPLWQAWSSAGTHFRMHGVPAAMELDTTVNSNRPAGVAIDDPVRWEDSALAGNYSMLAKAAGARTLFYQTSSDRKRSAKVTTKPVQVQAGYKRKTSDLRYGSCESEQLSNLASYLEASAQAGKKHILLGDHGWVILCMIARYGSKVIVPKASGDHFNLTAGGVPNAAVLHMLLHTSPNKPIVLEPQLLYESSLVSY